MNPQRNEKEAKTPEENEAGQQAEEDDHSELTNVHLQPPPMVKEGGNKLEASGGEGGKTQQPPVCSHTSNTSTLNLQSISTTSSTHQSNVILSPNAAMKQHPFSSFTSGSYSPSHTVHHRRLSVGTVASSLSGLGLSTSGVLPNTTMPLSSQNSFLSPPMASSIPTTLPLGGPPFVQQPPGQAQQQPQYIMEMPLISFVNTQQPGSPYHQLQGSYPHLSTSTTTTASNSFLASSQGAQQFSHVPIVPAPANPQQPMLYVYQQPTPPQPPQSNVSLGGQRHGRRFQSIPLDQAAVLADLQRLQQQQALTNDGTFSVCWDQYADRCRTNRPMCKYLHVVDLSYKPVPRDVCRDYLRHQCRRPCCRHFHGTTAELEELKLSGCPFYQEIFF